MAIDESKTEWKLDTFRSVRAFSLKLINSVCVNWDVSRSDCCCCTIPFSCLISSCNLANSDDVWLVGVDISVIRFDLSGVENEEYQPPKWNKEAKNKLEKEIVRSDTEQR